MRHEARMLRFVLAAALVAALAGAVAAAPAPVPPPALHYERLTGTVVAIDVRARRLDLLTGVGHALRLRRIHIPEALRVNAHGTESPMSVLSVGSICRVDCGSSPAGVSASKVELLENPAQAPRP